MLGRLSPEEVYQAIARGPLPAGGAARYTTVARLRAAGFTVRHTPTRRNPAHVSLAYDGIRDEAVCARLDACFDPDETRVG